MSSWQNLFLYTGSCTLLEFAKTLTKETGIIPQGKLRVIECCKWCGISSFKQTPANLPSLWALWTGEDYLLNVSLKAYGITLLKYDNIQNSFWTLVNIWHRKFNHMFLQRTLRIWFASIHLCQLFRCHLFFFCRGL